MIKRLPLLLLALILSVLIGGCYLYRQTPEQKIGRTVDQFLSNVEHRKLTTRRRMHVHEALTEVLAETVNFRGGSPIPNEELTLEEILEKVDFFHGFTSLCEMTELERTVRIEGDEAQVYHTTEIHVAAGKNHQGEEVWDLIFDLTEEVDGWKIVGIRGSRH